MKPSTLSGSLGLIRGTNYCEEKLYCNSSVPDFSSVVNVEINSRPFPTHDLNERHKQIKFPFCHQVANAEIFCPINGVINSYCIFPRPLPYGIDTFRI